jgi:hypothetical protein
MSNDPFRTGWIARLQGVVDDPSRSEEDKAIAQRHIDALEAGEPIVRGGTILVSDTTGEVVGTEPPATDHSTIRFTDVRPATPRTASIQVEKVSLAPNARKLARALRDWLARPGIRDRKLVSPTRELTQYIAGQPITYANGKTRSVPVLQPSDLRKWFQVSFLVPLLSGEPSNAQTLLLSLKHQALDARLEAARPIEGAIVRNYAITLAYCWTLGWTTECAVMLSELDRFAATRPGAVDDGSVCRLMVELWRLRTGHWPAGFVTEVPLVPGYQALLDTVLAPDPAAFEAATVQAAAFHTSRAKEHTSRETYEFVDELDRVFAAEILAAITLRRERGLPMPEHFTDKMVALSLHVFDALPDYQPDPLLEAVLARLPQDLPGFR